MSFVRPEVTRALHRWREVIAAAAMLLAGLWLMSRGGLVLGAIGGTVALAGAGLGLSALRRLRFAPTSRGPGLVEVDEGQVAWYGPGIGGFVSLAELEELGLVTVAGQRVWRLRQTGGQMLLVPVDADGADRLYDALTALPGIAGARLLAALEAGHDTPMIWRRNPAQVIRLSRP